MFSTLRVTVSIIISTLSIFGIGVADAQNFPNRPVRIIVSNGPGTSPDIVARLLAPEMGKILGQPVIVENRPGANMVIGYEYVAKRVPADGYTMALVYPTALVTLPVTVKGLRFDPLKDLQPLIGIGEGKLLLATSSQSPWKTFNEFVAYAKAHPGKLNYGAASAGTRLMTEGLTRGLGIEVTHIPYADTATLYQAILSGEIHITLVSAAAALSFGDKARMLAVTGATRSPTLPDAPTFAELGFQQLRGLSFSLNVPLGVPQPVLDKLYAAASQALQQPSLKASFANIQLEMYSDNTQQANATRLADEAAFIGDIAKKMAIEPQ